MFILIKAELLEVGDKVTYGWAGDWLYEVVRLCDNAVYIQRPGRPILIPVFHSDTVYLKVTDV